MQELTIDIHTNDGELSCFVAHPEGSGPFPAVILYMDAPGIREELRDFARRIAQQGYFCILPDMYYRLADPRFDLTKGEEEMKRMFAAMSTLSLDMVREDTGSLLQYLQNSDLVKGQVGIIGYCMSGRYVVSAAGHYPERINAVASLYGVGIVSDSDDSPHLLAPHIQAELYLGFAENDHYVSDNVIPELGAALKANGVRHVIETHAGTEHGFCFPGRGSMYNEAAAERVWGIVFDLFERNL